MEQDVMEARAAGAKGQSSTIDIQVGQEAAIWVIGFTVAVMAVVHVDLWAPYITDAWVYFF